MKQALKAVLPGSSILWRESVGCSRVRAWAFVASAALAWSCATTAAPTTVPSAAAKAPSAVQPSAAPSPSADVVGTNSQSSAAATPSAAPASSSVAAAPSGSQSSGGKLNCESSPPCGHSPECPGTTGCFELKRCPRPICATQADACALECGARASCNLLKSMPYQLACKL